MNICRFYLSDKNIPYMMFLSHKNIPEDIDKVKKQMSAIQFHKYTMISNTLIIIEISNWRLESMTV